jgi:hypothetical protein
MAYIRHATETGLRSLKCLCAFVKIKNGYLRMNLALACSMILLGYWTAGIAPVASGQEPYGKKTSSTATARIISMDQAVEMGQKDSVLYQSDAGYSRQLTDTIVQSRHLHILTLNCE